MFTEILNSGTLNLVYLATGLLSLLFSLITLIGVEAGDALDFDIDVDSDGGFDFISISPFALAIFGAFFGATGLITRIAFEAEAMPSILWAFLVALIGGGLAQAFFIYVLSPTRSSHFSFEEDAVGRDVEVTVSIPGDGLGTVAYNNVSGRVSLGARSATGRKIRSGTRVTIEQMSGRVAIVVPSEKEALSG